MYVESRTIERMANIYLTEQEKGKKTFNTLKGTIIPLSLRRSDENLEIHRGYKEDFTNLMLPHWATYSNKWCRCNFVSGTNKRLFEEKQLLIV